MEDKIQAVLDKLPDLLDAARATNDVNVILATYVIVKETGTAMKELADHLGLDVEVHTPID